MLCICLLFTGAFYQLRPIDAATKLTGESQALLRLNETQERLEARLGTPKDSKAYRLLEDTHRWVLEELEDSGGEAEEVDEGTYIFLHLLHGLRSGDRAYSNVMLQLFNEIKNKRQFHIYKTLTKYFTFEQRALYKAVKNYVKWYSKRTNLHFISEIIFLLSEDYKLFDIISSNRDIGTIEWLLKSRMDSIPFDINEIESLKGIKKKDFISDATETHLQNKSSEEPNQNERNVDFIVQNGDIDALIHLMESNTTCLLDIVVSSLKLNRTRVVDEFLPKLIRYNLTPEAVNKLFQVIIIKNGFDILVKIIKNGFPINQEDFEGATLLFKAIESNNSKMVEFLLKAGANVNFTTHCNKSLLHTAVIKGKINVLEGIIDLGGYMYSEDCQGRTPMHVAILTNNKEMVRVLVENDFDVNRKFSDGNTIIFCAVNASVQILKYLIDSGCKINVVNDDNVIPLLEALLSRRSSAVKILMDKGANINFTTSNGNNLMHLCAMRGSWWCIDALRSLGLSIESKNDDNEPPLYTAVEYNRAYVVKELVQSGADYTISAKNGDTLLHVAVVSGSAGALRALLKVGIDPDSEGHGLATPMERAVRLDDPICMQTLKTYGADIHRSLSYSYKSTLLHDAARYGRDRAAAWLMDSGISPDVTEISGWTPLHWAVMKGFTSTVYVLLNHSAKVDPVDKDGITPLYIAARRGYPQILQELLNHKANVDAKIQNGYSALHAGAVHGHHSIVHEILNYEPNVNIKTNNGNTPLHLASWKGHLSIVQELILYPADINSKNKSGYTPLHVATIFGHINIIKEFINHKADLNAKTDSGFTALDLAKKWKHRKIEELLNQTIS